MEQSSTGWGETHLELFHRAGEPSPQDVFPPPPAPPPAFDRGRTRRPVHHSLHPCWASVLQSSATDSPCTPSRGQLDSQVKCPAKSARSVCCQSPEHAAIPMLAPVDPYTVRAGGVIRCRRCTKILHPARWFFVTPAAKGLQRGIKPKTTELSGMEYHRSGAGSYSRAERTYCCWICGRQSRPRDRLAEALWEIGQLVQL